MVAEGEWDLPRDATVADRKAIEESLRNFKRAALTVWLDARIEGFTPKIGNVADSDPTQQRVADVD